MLPLWRPHLPSRLSVTFGLSTPPSTWAIEANLRQPLVYEVVQFVGYATYPSSHDVGHITYLKPCSACVEGLRWTLTIRVIRDTPPDTDGLVAPYATRAVLTPESITQSRVYAEGSLKC